MSVNLVYSIPFPDQTTLEAEANVFARANGWKPYTQNENGETVDNPVTALEFGRLRLNKLIEETNSRYRADEAAKAAHDAVYQASTGAYQAITTTLEIVAA